MITPSLLELCDHARTSCRVSGLIPKEWRWGKDVWMAFAYMTEGASFNPPFGAKGKHLFTIFQGLPVFLMDDRQQTGVACIGKKPYVSLLEKND